MRATGTVIDKSPARRCACNQTGTITDSHHNKVHINNTELRLSYVGICFFLHDALRQLLRVVLPAGTACDFAGLGFMAGPHAGNRNRPAYSGQSRFRFPKQVIELFTPRKPLEFKPPPRHRRLRAMTGIAGYVDKFVNGSVSKKGANEVAAFPKDANAIESGKEVAVSTKFEAPAQRRLRKSQEALGKIKSIVEANGAQWDPFAEREGVRKTKNALNTLFVTGIPKDILEERLRTEFESYGPVLDVIIPKDRGGVPRGYAFIEFERERDFKIAYKEAGRRKIDGRRILVDVERGRTVKTWKPNRLDGPNNACAKSKEVERGTKRSR